MSWPLGSLCAHSGAMTGLPETAFSGATNPPPNLATRVNVCVSPPRLIRVSVVSSSTSARVGLNLQAPALFSWPSSNRNPASVWLPRVPQARLR
jgi:hypothetical protein